MMTEAVRAMARGACAGLPAEARAAVERVLMAQAVSCLEAELGAGGGWRSRVLRELRKSAAEMGAAERARVEVGA